MSRKTAFTLVATLVPSLVLAGEPEVDYREQLSRLRELYEPKLALLESEFESEAKKLHQSAQDRLSDAVQHFKSSDEEDALEKANEYDRRWRTLKSKKLPSLIRVPTSRIRMQQEIDSLKDQFNHFLGLDRQLVANPGCEEVEPDGSISVWTTQAGSWAPREVKKAKGKYLFFAERSSHAVLMQEVDISAASIMADEGGLEFTASVDLWCLSQSPADSGELVILLKDADGKELQKHATGKKVSKDAWKNLKLSATVAPKTRSIVVKLVAYRTGPSGSKQNDAQFDQVSLVLSPVADY